MRAWIVSAKNDQDTIHSLIGNRVLAMGRTAHGSPKTLTHDMRHEATRHSIHASAQIHSYAELFFDKSATNVNKTVINGIRAADAFDAPIIYVSVLAVALAAVVVVVSSPVSFDLTRLDEGYSRIHIRA